MLLRLLLGFLLVPISAVSVVAHHGWGSYDASKPITVTGPIETSKYENPHATITVKAGDKVWTVTLAPVSRMQSRGASPEFVGVGKTVSAYGYPQRSRKTRCAPSASPSMGRPSRCDDAARCRPPPRRA